MLDHILSHISHVAENDRPRQGVGSASSRPSGRGPTKPWQRSQLSGKVCHKSSALSMIELIMHHGPCLFLEALLRLLLLGGRLGHIRLMTATPFAAACLGMCPSASVT